MKRTIAIVGAGNGGMTYAADLAVKGHDVRLCELPGYEVQLEPIAAAGGIKISGVESEGFGKLSLVTADVSKAVKGADLVIAPVPAFAFEAVAQAYLPCAENGQVIVISGKGGGSITLAQKAAELGIEATPTFGETNTLLYGCRKVGGAEVKQFGIIRENVTGAFPGKNRDKVVELLSDIYPDRSFRPAVNVLECILVDFNSITHTAPMICNAARIDSGYRKGEFYLFDKYGNPPAVCRVIEAVDRERVRIQGALGMPEWTIAEEHVRNGYNPGKSKEVLPMYESMHTEKLESVPGPYSLKARHLSEDIPYGLVTWVSLADLLKIPVPACRSITTLASILNAEDYWATGRTIDKLGIDPSWSRQQLEHYLFHGDSA